jgi:phenylacetate-coenzyme A ligase PaaK-like adenylate-forming protein
VNDISLQSIWGNEWRRGDDELARARNAARSSHLRIVGDFGNLQNQCPCGHDGPIISNIYGRGKHFLRHPNGKLLPFHVSTRALLEVTTFKECRIRQHESNTITVELGGRESITTGEAEKLKRLIIKITDPAFKVEIKLVREIDWSHNPKRLFFASSVA